MFSKFDKASPFKNAKESYQLNPSYLYDIELLTQTKNWMKLDLRQKQPSTPIKSAL